MTRVMQVRFFKGPWDRRQEDADSYIAGMIAERDVDHVSVFPGSRTADDLPQPFTYELQPPHRDVPFRVALAPGWQFRTCEFRRAAADHEPREWVADRMRTEMRRFLQRERAEQVYPADGYLPVVVGEERPGSLTDVFVCRVFAVVPLAGYLPAQTVDALAMPGWSENMQAVLSYLRATYGFADGADFAGPGARPVAPVLTASQRDELVARYGGPRGPHRPAAAGGRISATAFDNAFDNTRAMIRAESGSVVADLRAVWDRFGLGGGVDPSVRGVHSDAGDMSSPQRSGPVRARWNTVVWPDEGYPCQLCWAVGRWPWEPMRSCPWDVNPESTYCKEHAASAGPAAAPASAAGGGGEGQP